MERQQSTIIPEMTISYIKQEYAIVEASKTKDDTKQINESGKKCPELMAKTFDQLLELCPSEQRTIPVHGCLLSELNCTPLELSCPKGYIKLIKRGKTMQHPESPAVFKTRMCNLLAHLWRFRLAIEDMCRYTLRNTDTPNKNVLMWQCEMWLSLMLIDALAADVHVYKNLQIYQVIHTSCF